MIKKIIIFIIFVLITNLLSADEYSYKNFYIFSNNLDNDGFTELKTALDKIEEYFILKYNYIPDNQLNIFIFDSVNSMTDKLEIPYWIGGYYSKETVFLQPIDILIKKNVFEKVLFIEYAHYYIDSYTYYKCPYWLNEMISFEYYLEYSGKLIKVSSDKKFSNFEDFINIEKNMMKKETMNNFYTVSSFFITFLNKKYKNNIFEYVLMDMHNNISFNESIKKYTGKDIKLIFEEEFLE